MSRSPPDRMPFGVQPLSGSTIAICGPVRQNHICFLCVRVLCHRTDSLCAMGIKLPSSGLLLIVLSLWRLNQLPTVKFAYSTYNTLSLKFSPRTLLALFTATTLAIPGLRIRLSMFLLLQEGISGPPFLCYSESSRCTLPRWWKSTPR
ncbi:hypothetical protein TNCV_3158211 [Trichonephila clavipes]|nr:hypothetical protein TNCV_3158211 [Trichonephila clavipes]